MNYHFSNYCVFTSHDLRQHRLFGGKKSQKESHRIGTVWHPLWEQCEIRWMTSCTCCFLEAGTGEVVTGPLSTVSSQSCMLGPIQVELCHKTPHSELCCHEQGAAWGDSMYWIIFHLVTIFSAIFHLLHDFWPHICPHKIFQLCSLIIFWFGS